MNRANQHALFQATNQGLLGIRQAEINYYLNLHLSFGTQAALIGGFTYGVFTQNQLNDQYSYSEVFEDLYWIMSAATIAASVHVIINTMVLQVLGPGLALHGPIGSIARATEGMKVEQKQIVTSFILMMILFALSTTMSFWMVMNFESAVGSTAVFVIAARYWYYYTERIYLRFYWDPEKSAWDEQKEENDEDSMRYNPADRPATSGGLGNTQRLASNERRTSSDRGSAQNVNMGNEALVDTDKKKKKSFFKFFGYSSKKRANSISASSKIRPGRGLGAVDKLSANNLAGGSRHIAMEGYLSKSAVTLTAGTFATDRKAEPWERRYFTLSLSGHLYYFNNRMDYRANPKSPVNKRPLNLPEYNVVVNNSDEEVRRSSVEGGVADDDSDDGGLVRRQSYNFFATASVAESQSGVAARNSLQSRPRFQMTLVLKDEDSDQSSRRWLLRCDTEEELGVWISIMQEVSPGSFGSDYQPPVLQK